MVALVVIIVLLLTLAYARTRLVYWRTEAYRLKTMLEDGEMTIRVDPGEPVTNMRLHLNQDR